MKPVVLLLALLLAACGSAGDNRTTLTVQRFFGACAAEYGSITDVAKAEGECGIMTAIINRFEAENPNIRVVENIVFWPGYDQLTAQLASNDAPDLVTMHGSVISDYQARGLIAPMDGELARIGVTPAAFTDAARAAVTIDGRVWGMPIDTWAPLWHINMNLFRQAGLVRGGKPILPTSPQELIAQAEQFKQRTFVMQQQGDLFANPCKANFRTPQAAEAIRLFKQIYDRDLTTKNQDYSAAVSGFLRGDGGVFLVGTWMVGNFEAAARAETGALADGYAVMPYPQLYPGRDVTYADGHNWVMPTNPERTPAESAAALKFLKFFADHEFDWSRTGHLPALQAVIDSPEWRALPQRDALAGLATTAAPLPKGVRRQFPIETIVGQEAAAAISGAKPIPTALADMERRVNDILENL